MSSEITTKLRKFRLKSSQIVKSSKFDKLMEIMPPLFDKDSRVVLFSQFTMMMDIMEVLLDHHQIGFLERVLSRFLLKISKEHVYIIIAQEPYITIFGSFGSEASFDGFLKFSQVLKLILVEYKKPFCSFCSSRTRSRDLC